MIEKRATVTKVVALGPDDDLITLGLDDRDDHEAKTMTFHAKREEYHLRDKVRITVAKVRRRPPPLTVKTADSQIQQAGNQP